MILWTGFNWLKTGTSGTYCEQGMKFHKTQETSCPGDRLLTS